MTQEDKELLLKDLCARLPYGIIGAVTHYDENGEGSDLFGRIEGINHRNEVMFVYLPEYTDDVGAYNNFEFTLFKPCLRPMSSMTEEEMQEYELLANRTIVTSVGFVHLEATELIEWLNKKMFDYRGLIPKGRAIEVTEDNNPYK